MKKFFVLTMVFVLALTACDSMTAPTETPAPEPTTVPPTAEVVVVTVEVPVEAPAEPTAAPPTPEPTATLPPAPEPPPEKWKQMEIRGRIDIEGLPKNISGTIEYKEK